MLSFSYKQMFDGGNRMKRTYNPKISKELNDKLDKRARVVTIQKRVLIMAIICILFIIILLTSGMNIFASAEEKEVYTYYKSIEIDENDTLWSIAKEYAPDSDIENYIAEVEEMNGIDGNQIHTGDYIIVPYYSSDVK